jgi:hypothetical protein
MSRLGRRAVSHARGDGESSSESTGSASFSALSPGLASPGTSSGSSSASVSSAASGASSIPASVAAAPPMQPAAATPGRRVLPTSSTRGPLVLEHRETEFTRPEFLLLMAPPRPAGRGSGASVSSAASSVGLPAVVGLPSLDVATPPPAVCPATVRPVAAVLAEDQDLLPGPRVTTWLLEGFPLRALDPKCLAVAGRLFLQGDWAR